MTNPSLSCAASFSTRSLVPAISRRGGVPPYPGVTPGSANVALIARSVAARRSKRASRVGGISSVTLGCGIPLPSATSRRPPLIRCRVARSRPIVAGFQRPVLRTNGENLIVRVRCATAVSAKRRQPAGQVSDHKCVKAGSLAADGEVDQLVDAAERRAAVPKPEFRSCPKHLSKRISAPSAKGGPSDRRSPGQVSRCAARRATALLVVPCVRRPLPGGRVSCPRG